MLFPGMFVSPKASIPSSDLLSLPREPVPFSGSVFPPKTAHPIPPRLFRRRLIDNLQEGDTVRVIVNNNYNTTGFGGRKYVVLSTLNFLGGRNHVLGVTYITVGALGLTAALLILAFKYRLKRPTDSAIFNKLKNV